MKRKVTTRFQRVIALIMAVIVALITAVLGSGRLNAVAASTHTLTYYDTRYNDGLLRVGYFEIDGGQWAMCVCHEMEPPTAGQTLTTVQTYTYENQANELLRKVFYYGWKGPGDIGGTSDGEHYRETCLAASVANGHDDNYYGYGQAFINRISHLANAPKGFNVFKLSNGSGAQQDLGYWEYHPTGYLKVTKTSANSDISDGNENYILADASYGVYSDKACTKQVATLKTDENGASNTVELDYGTYYLKELESPRGYELDDVVYPVQVNAQETTNQKLSDYPKHDDLGIKIYKIDAETGKPDPQGDADLSGAEFTLKFYAGLYEKEELADVEPTRTWVIQTRWSEEEQAYVAGLNEAYKVSGDSFYYAEDNQNGCLPIGTITVEETKAPTGYLLEGAYLISGDLEETIEGMYYSQITETGDAAELSGGNTYTLSEQGIRGGVKVQKRDFESKEDAALGGATLSGAVFTITNQSGHAVVVDGKEYAVGEAVYTLTTDENGQAGTEADLLPYGTYLLSEAEAPTGYLPEGILERTFSITEDGVIVNLTEPDQSIQNQVKRGDFELTKIDERTQKVMSNVRFKVTSNTTGESHEFTTDVNGFYSSASSWNLHSANTNSGGAEDGMWFGLSGSGENVAVNDELGALPYDTYTIEELRCEANKGKELYSDILVINRDGYVVKKGNIENRDVKVGTTATDQTSGTHTAVPAEKNTIIDVVSYEGVEAGLEHKLVGVLMNYDTKEPVMVDGKAVTAEGTFVPEDSKGTAEVVFTFDGRGLGGSTTVVFEELYEVRDGEEILIGEHKEYDSKEQTIVFEEPEKPSPSVPMKTPRTGDQSNVWMWRFATGIAMALMLGVVLWKRYKRK